LSGAPIEILLLEDSTLDAELMGEHLRRAAIAHVFDRVWTEADFVAALDRRRHDLILADYTLPSFDGLSALKIARARAPQIPFILASATLSEEAAIEAMRQGASDFVVKERLRRLPGAVRRALNEAAERAGRERAERRLEDINAHLETIIDERTGERDRIWRLSQDLFAVFDLQDRILSANPAWKAVLGWSPAAVEGRANADFKYPADRHIPIRPAGQEGDAIVDTVVRYSHRDGGHRWIAWRAAAPQNGRIFAVGRDVTEAKVQTEAIARAQDQLRQAQKMEAIGQLTGGVAHDFNNLLTVIIGNLEMLQRREADALSERGRGAVDNAMNGARRAALLTSSLLAFARRQPLAPRPIDANAQIAGMSDLLDRSLTERVRVETVLQPGLWTAHADANQLESAILNLALNARDAMPGGGTLTIETANVVLDDAYCRDNDDVEPGAYVGIFVGDTGDGMDSEVQARAFDPFFTTKDIGQGTGLGLSQVYGFAKQSGGHVRIFSAPGAGTTIRLYLPRRDMPAGVVERADVAPSAPPGGRETILVVEDEDRVRAHSTAILEELGYRVLAAADGPAGLDMLRRHPGVALLLSDLGLPKGMDGEQLAVLARRLLPGLKVLFVSGYARSVVDHDGQMPAGTELITKPFTFDGLARRVRGLLDRPAGAGPAAPRILLVEDEELVRMVAAELLQEAGFEVDEAGNAAEALAKARERAGTLAAAIVDIGLPDMPGDRVAADLWRLHPGLPIVVASGQDTDVVRRRFGSEDRVDFVGKPYQSDDVIRSLARLGIRPDRVE
jgi:PAS domain S-box-containing protein